MLSLATAPFQGPLDREPPAMDSLQSIRTALDGRYAVERLWGQGGMATVYLARDARHGRQVAIKVLRPELAASVGSDRFLREIKLAANLQHPNILALYDSGEAAGFLYYVMPFVQGESLRARLNREGQLSLPDASSPARWRRRSNARTAVASCTGTSNRRTS